MIQQPVQQSIQQPICDSASQCSGNGVEHSWLGHGVAVAKAFAKSLIPMEDPHFSINPDKALEGIGRLATAIILPTSPILFIAKDIADAWFGSCLPEPDAKPELPQTSKATGEEAQEKEPGSQDVPLQQPSAARYQGSQGTRGLLALGTLASSFQYANSNAIAGDPIPIKDAETLGMIGRPGGHPLDGTYHQTADIDVPQGFQAIGRGKASFTGKYDGRCNTIKGLNDCLVYDLKGSISNLGFTDGTINERVAGLAACVVGKNGNVNDIWAKNINITTESIDGNASIGSGEVREGGRVANITAVECWVTSTNDNSNVGIGGGRVYKGGTVYNTTAMECEVVSKGDKSNAGIGGGKVEGKVEHTTAVDCKVETSRLANAGIGGGQVDKGGSVSYTTAVDSKVTAFGSDACAGIGGGLVKGGIVSHTTVVVSEVIDSGGHYVCDGIGGRVDKGGSVSYTTAVDIKVNGQLKNCPSDSNYHLRCQNADPRVLIANCSIRSEFQDSGFSYNDACPGNGITASRAEAALADTRVSTDAAESTAATAAGITIGTLVAVSGLGIVGYSTYQWITGYREGLRGKKLATRPLTRGKELASAAVNSVSQGIQGARERMNRQRVPVQKPDHEMSQILTDRVTELDKRW